MSDKKQQTENKHKPRLNRKHLRHLLVTNQLDAAIRFLEDYRRRSPVWIALDARRKKAADGRE